MYEMAKHIHLTAIGISLILFTFRFFLSLKSSDILQKKWLKITPHVVDTILLASAVCLLFISPMGENTPWVLSKVIGVILYIVSGFFTLKWARNNPMRAVGFVSAWVWIMVTMGIAFSKQPFSFLA